MKDTRGQSYIRGAMILTGATLLVKLIGMFYKIPVYNILGATGWSCFMVAYSIFNPVYSLSVSGFPAAISKMVSESAAAGCYRDVRRIFRVSFSLLLVLGLAGFAVLFFGAGPLSAAVGNGDARLSVIIMAPSLLFCCVMSAYRGYHQGLRNMTPTAVSQVIEAVVKLVCGVGFALYAVNRGMGVPYVAAAAVLGVTVSSVMGAVYLFVRQLLRGGGLPKGNMPFSRTAESSLARPAGQILRTLLALAFPVCLASLLAHVTNLIDLATVIHRVGTAVERDSAAVLGMYAGLIPEGVSLAELPVFLHGAYSSTSSLYNLVPALTVTLGISALPMVAANWATHAREKATMQMHAVLKMTTLLAVPAGLGLAVMARPIMDMLYASQPLDVAIAAPVLRSLGVAMALVGITTPMCSLFQAIGRADIPVKLMAGGAVIKTVANYVLIAIPSLNIRGAPYGTTLCYAFIFLGGLVLLRHCTGRPLRYVQIFVKPFICGLFCAVAAHTSYELLYRAIPSRFTCLVAIAIGGSIYMIFVLFLRIITKNEVFLIPGGKKIAKILEKLSLLG